ncbi:YBL086C [Zygosaccharomyces parabailii]|uniref:ZYBA0S08-02982g1_1 n=1 Tax=Zygosaccharomyces bailii (strain CLIB 213 / ATCC 58445 / CBS 680 / BCRC 21525 / NBRC 1098 / NCYC 1416 / NRRL Y-2227) TaxID=1333698 RepID=A0A8J2T9E2_ZYGB2|nr:YBL086C [Zygosaccharomyces parabailii]CDF90786.1 ZYBA0S08-02982g1_1 [Zygosaccharomyces bailii CLIB 213]
MPLLGGKSKATRPKFLLNLRIDELINIPQSSGYCFVRWHLKEGTGSSGHRLAKVSSDDEASLGAHQSHGLTPRVLVENHRARWNYQLEKPIQVKLQVGKNKKLEAKKLVLDVYFEFLETGPKEAGINRAKRTSLEAPNIIKTSNNVYAPKVSGKLHLGSVSLNISEYVRRDEQPLINRFLLKKSKVNSIINVTVQMKLIRGSYDDFDVSKTASGQLPGNVRSGIDDILEDSSDKSSPISSTYQSSQSGSPRSNQYPQSIRGSVRMVNGNMSPLNASVNGSVNGKAQSYMGMTSPSTQGNTISSSINPLVENLYQKTFQLPWDPRPGEFTPKECVEDILQGGNGWARNEKGISLIDIQALKLIEMEVDYKENEQFGANEKMNANKRMEKASSADDYNAMDKREFLEKKQNWSHVSQTQRDKIKNENNEGNAMLEEGEAQLEDFTAEQIKDTKSWTVHRILA